MSARFVSAGGEEVQAPEGLSAVQDDAWAKARKQVEEARKPHVREGPAPGTQADGKSLYEHLQAQRAAKQEAFEEASKLRNQFRPLDDNEVEFLESVKRRERLESADVQKQTAEQLETFRKEQAAAEQLALEDAQKQQEAPTKAEADASVWNAAKKRRRAQPTNSIGAKSRKLSSEDSTNDLLPPSNTEVPDKGATHDVRKTTNTSSEAAVKSKLGEGDVKPVSSLVAYDSDSDG